MKIEKYLINGKEVELLNWNDEETPGRVDFFNKLNELIMALGTEVKPWINSQQEEKKEECKHKNTGTCLACHNEVIKQPSKPSIRESVEEIISDSKYYSIADDAQKALQLVTNAIMEEVKKKYWDNRIAGNIITEGNLEEIINNIKK